MNHPGDGFRKQCLLYYTWTTIIHYIVEAYQLWLVSTFPWIWQWALIWPGSLCRRCTYKEMWWVQSGLQARHWWLILLQNSVFWKQSGAWYFVLLIWKHRMPGRLSARSGLCFLLQLQKWGGRAILEHIHFWDAYSWVTQPLLQHLEISVKFSTL